MEAQEHCDMLSYAARTTSVQRPVLPEPVAVAVRQPPALVEIPGSVTLEVSSKANWKSSRRREAVRVESKCAGDRGLGVAVDKRHGLC